MRSIRIVLGGMLLVVLGGAAWRCAADEFRVETEVFADGTKEPAVQTRTIFSEGVVYDFLLNGVEEITIFDRSWYGRVLVERVEGYCSEPAWMRAYSEINDFEEQMDRHGIVVAKFWLAITPEEQLKRFRERAVDAGGSQRQELRAHQDLEDPVPAHRRGNERLQGNEERQVVLLRRLRRLDQHVGPDHDRPHVGIGLVPGQGLSIGDAGDLAGLHPLRHLRLVVLGDLVRHVNQVQPFAHRDCRTAGKEALQFFPGDARRFQIHAGALDIFFSQFAHYVSC